MVSRVLLTDHPWEQLDIERGVLGAAGLELVEGPMRAPDAATVAAMVRGADPVAILTCWAPVDQAAIAAPTELRIVARLGVGLDNIDVAAATARGAWVTNVPDYCVEEVSDHAVGLALAFERGIAVLDRAVRGQGWHVPTFVPRRIADLTVGIIGFGRIGRRTAAKFRAFGCTVLAVDPHAKDVGADASLVTMVELQRQADIIVLHAPLLDSSLHMIDDGFIVGCARRPLLVNVSRGGLIDNAALERGLEAGRLRGAALDVIEGEPSPPASLLARPDMIVTPHIAYLSDASVAALRRSACEEVVRVLSGAAPLQGRNQPAPGPAAVLLDGGVSSDIVLRQTADGPLVVKTALARLKVAADWRSDPARSQTEVDAIRAAQSLLGEGSVPHIVWARPEEHCFAMRLVDQRLRNWKRDLLAGRVDALTAAAAGTWLGRLHRRSMRRDDLAVRFADDTIFHELRIAPFFEAVASARPELAGDIAAVVAGLGVRKSCLVHGDYSPKNLLVDGPDLVVLDFEVAHWGDPRFDVAFCLSHLLLKAGRAGADRAAFAAAAAAFLSGYATENGPAQDDAELARLTGCLVLARLEGSSPVEYRADLDVAVIDRMAVRLLAEPPTSILAAFAAAPEFAQ